MKTFFKENFEKIKLIGIVLFCILVGSGSAKNFFYNTSNTDEIVLSHQEIVTAIEEPKESATIDASAGSTSEIESKVDSSKININSADSQMLQTLLGIGPVKADSIINYRDDYGGFTSIEEITEVKGIGHATFTKIKDYITIE